MALVVEAGKSKSLKIGMDPKILKEKMDSLMNSFVNLPSSVLIDNQTKTCEVTMLVSGSNFIIRITNPDDATFRL